MVLVSDRLRQFCIWWNVEALFLPVNRRKNSDYGDSKANIFCSRSIQTGPQWLFKKLSSIFAILILIAQISFEKCKIFVQSLYMISKPLIYMYLCLSYDDHRVKHSNFLYNAKFSPTSQRKRSSPNSKNVMGVMFQGCFVFADIVGCSRYWVYKLWHSVWPQIC